MNEMRVWSIRIILPAVLALFHVPSLPARMDEEPTRAKERDSREEPSPRKVPAFHNLRFEEDWSVLKGSSGRQGWLALKYIPLGGRDDFFLSLGGQWRGRVETWSDFGFGGPGRRDDTFGLSRLRLHSDLVLGPHFRLFLETKSSLATGRNLPGGLRILDVDSVDLQNALADLRFSLGQGIVRLRAGRQEMQFGRQRLVSPLDWSNTRPRMFDGVHLSLNGQDWQLDGFWSRFVRVRKYQFNNHDSGVDFFGLYSSKRLADQHLQMEGYWLALESEKSRWSGLTAPERRHTLGGRLFWEPAQRNLDVELEGAYQWGRHGKRQIAASMFTSVVGLNFSRPPWRPRLALEFDYASGDKDPGDNRLETFHQLFPLGHAYLGFADFVGRQNVFDFTPSLHLYPTQKFTLRLDVHLFWLVREEDALYNAGGGIVRTGQASLPRRVGSELDWTAHYQFNRHTRLELGYSHFFAGPFLAATGPERGMDFAYVALQYTF